MSKDKEDNKAELRCDTTNDTNRYYVIDYNLGVEVEIHGAIQFKTVNKDGKVVYKSHITVIDVFLKELAAYQKDNMDRFFKEMGESISKAYENDTLYTFDENGKFIKWSEKYKK